jgi:hypothetical protein
MSKDGLDFDSPPSSQMSKDGPTPTHRRRRRCWGTAPVGDRLDPDLRGGRGGRQASPDQVLENVAVGVSRQGGP